MHITYIWLLLLQVIASKESIRFELNRQQTKTHPHKDLLKIDGQDLDLPIQSLVGANNEEINIPNYRYGWSGKMTFGGPGSTMTGWVVFDTESTYTAITSSLSSCSNVVYDISICPQCSNDVSVEYTYPSHPMITNPIPSQKIQGTMYEDRACIGSLCTSYQFEFIAISNQPIGFCYQMNQGYLGLSPDKTHSFLYNLYKYKSVTPMISFVFYTGNTAQAVLGGSDKDAFVGTLYSFNIQDAGQWAVNVDSIQYGNGSQSISTNIQQQAIVTMDRDYISLLQFSSDLVPKFKAAGKPFGIVCTATSCYMNGYCTSSMYNAFENVVITIDNIEFTLTPIGYLGGTYTRCMVLFDQAQTTMYLGTTFIKFFYTELNIETQTVSLALNKYAQMAMDGVEPAPKSKLNLGLIIGASVGSLVMLIILCICCRICKKNRGKNLNASVSEQLYAQQVDHPQLVQQQAQSQYEQQQAQPQQEQQQAQPQYGQQQVQPQYGQQQVQPQYGQQQVQPQYVQPQMQQHQSSVTSQQNLTSSVQSNQWDQSVPSQQNLTSSVQSNHPWDQPPDISH